MIVERATKDDIPALAELYEQLMGTMPDVEAMAREFGHLQRDSRYALLVAREEGPIGPPIGPASGPVIGTAMGIVCRDLVGKAQPFLLVENVVVDERCRAKGAGAMLVRALEAFGRGAGCYGAVLMSSNERTQAHAFYQRLGYSAAAAGFRKVL